MPDPVLLQVLVAETQATDLTRLMQHVLHVAWASGVRAAAKAMQGRQQCRLPVERAHSVRLSGCAQRCWAAGHGGSVGAIDGGLARRRVPSRVLRGKLPHKRITGLRAGLRRGCHSRPRSAWRVLLSAAARPVRGWLLNRILRPASSTGTALGTSVVQYRSPCILSDVRQCSDDTPGCREHGQAARCSFLRLKVTMKCMRHADHHIAARGSRAHKLLRAPSGDGSWKAPACLRAPAAGSFVPWMPPLANIAREREDPQSAGPPGLIYYLLNVIVRLHMCLSGMGAICVSGMPFTSRGRHGRGALLSHSQYIVCFKTSVCARCATVAPTLRTVLSVSAPREGRVAAGALRQHDKDWTP